jgi:magnesium chelatase family protein
LHVDVPAVSPADLSLPPPRENLAEVANRVARVRQIQRERYEKLALDKSLRTNADADGDLLEKVAAPDAPGRELLTQAAERLRLSARGYHRIMRVARTLADMDGRDNVGRIHVAEALSYR